MCTDTTHTSDPDGPRQRGRTPWWRRRVPEGAAEEHGCQTRFTFLNNKKQDDLADSLLLVCYFLDTYSNQLSSDPLVDIEAFFADALQ